MTEKTRQELQSKVNEKYKEVCSLVYRRDNEQYRKCRYYETSYQILIGEYAYDLKKWQYETFCRRNCYLMIADAFEKGEAVFLPEIKTKGSREFLKEKRELKNRRACINCAEQHAERWYELNEDEEKELCELYRDIVPFVHPDLVDDLTDYEQELFYNAIGAFSDGDLDLLRQTVADIYTLPTTHDRSDEYSLRKEWTRLLVIERKVKKEMESLKTEYSQKIRDLIDSPENVKNTQQELQTGAAMWKRAAEQYEVDIGHLLGA